MSPPKRIRGACGDSIRTWPVEPYERAGQPEVYMPLIAQSNGADRQYNLTLSYEKFAAGAGIANDITVAWNLSMAPKPDDGKVHKAQWSVSQLHVYQPTSNLFTANTCYLACLDVPQPNSFCGTNMTTGDATEKAATLQRPNAFYKFFNESNSKYLTLDQPSENITSFVGVYPVPAMRFSMRTVDLPCRYLQGANNEKFNVGIHIKIVLLD